jgi:hypothetical protein
MITAGHPTKSEAIRLYDSSGHRVYDVKITETYKIVAKLRTTCMYPDQSVTVNYYWLPITTSVDAVSRNLKDLEKKGIHGGSDNRNFGLSLGTNQCPCPWTPSEDTPTRGHTLVIEAFTPVNYGDGTFVAEPSGPCFNTRLTNVASYSTITVGPAPGVTHALRAHADSALRPPPGRPTHLLEFAVVNTDMERDITAHLHVERVEETDGARRYPGLWRSVPTERFEATAFGLVKDVESVGDRRSDVRFGCPVKVAPGTIEIVTLWLDGPVDDEGEEPRGGVYRVVEYRDDEVTGRRKVGEILAVVLSRDVPLVDPDPDSPDRRDDQPTLEPLHGYRLTAPVTNTTGKTLTGVSAHVESITAGGDDEIRLPLPDQDLGDIQPDATATAKWDLDFSDAGVVGNVSDVSVCVSVSDESHDFERTLVAAAQSGTGAGNP